jgi:hypothetical protein
MEIQRGPSIRYRRCYRFIFSGVAPVVPARFAFSVSDGHEDKFPQAALPDALASRTRFDIPYAMHRAVDCVELRFQSDLHLVKPVLSRIPLDSLIGHPRISDGGRFGYLKAPAIQENKACLWYTSTIGNPKACTPCAMLIR